MEYHLPIPSTVGFRNAAPVAASTHLVTLPTTPAVLGFLRKTSTRSVTCNYSKEVKASPRTNRRISRTLTWARTSLAQPWPARASEVERRPRSCFPDGEVTWIIASDFVSRATDLSGCPFVAVVNHLAVDVGAGGAPFWMQNQMVYGKTPTKRTRAGMWSFSIGNRAR